MSASALRRSFCGARDVHGEHVRDAPVFGPGAQVRCPGAVRNPLRPGTIPADVDPAACYFCHDAPVGNASAWTTLGAPLSAPCPACGKHYAGPMPA